MNNLNLCGTSALRVVSVSNFHINMAMTEFISKTIILTCQYLLLMTFYGSIALFKITETGFPNI